MPRDAHEVGIYGRSTFGEPSKVALGGKGSLLCLTEDSDWELNQPMGEEGRMQETGPTCRCSDAFHGEDVSYSQFHQKTRVQPRKETLYRS